MAKAQINPNTLKMLRSVNGKACRSCCHPLYDTTSCPRYVNVSIDSETWHVCPSTPSSDPNYDPDLVDQPPTISEVQYKLLEADRTGDSDYVQSGPFKGAKIISGTSADYYLLVWCLDGYWHVRVWWMGSTGVEFGIGLAWCGVGGDNYIQASFSESACGVFTGSGCDVCGQSVPLGPGDEKAVKTHCGGVATLAGNTFMTLLPDTLTVSSSGVIACPGQILDFNVSNVTLDIAGTDFDGNTIYSAALSGGRTIRVALNKDWDGWWIVYIRMTAYISPDYFVGFTHTATGKPTSGSFSNELTPSDCGSFDGEGVITNYGGQVSI
jgi:hypothetical protein